MDLQQTELMEQVQYLLSIFQQTGALLEGHFQLTSGLHSPRYLQCALVLQYPQHAEWVGRALASHFKDDKISAVVAPAIGGIILAHETARALGVRALFTEREAGQMKLRRGFHIDDGERVLPLMRSRKQAVKSLARARLLIAAAEPLMLVRDG
jgi:orotate phosphoribosyltransferase